MEDEVGQGHLADPVLCHQADHSVVAGHQSAEGGERYLAWHRSPVEAEEPGPQPSPGFEVALLNGPDHVAIVTGL